MFFASLDGKQAIALLCRVSRDATGTTTQLVHSLVRGPNRMMPRWRVCCKYMQRRTPPTSAGSSAGVDSCWAPMSPLVFPVVNDVATPPNSPPVLPPPPPTHKHPLSFSYRCCSSVAGADDDSPDSGAHTVADAVADNGADSATHTGIDARTDSWTDAGTGARTDARTDAGSLAGTDSGTFGGAYGGGDGVSDRFPNGSADAGSHGGADHGRYRRPYRGANRGGGRPRAGVREGLHLRVRCVRRARGGEGGGGAHPGGE